MHARELIELAAFITTRGEWLLANPQQVTPMALARYTRASKARLERWNAALFHWQSEGVHEFERAELVGLCEEVLTSEVLLRVWSTLQLSCQRLQADAPSEQEIHQLFNDHLLASQQVYAALLDETLVPSHEALSLNRLRRRAEGWTDVLVGHLVSTGAVDLFAPHRDRALQFSLEQRNERREPQAWKLVLASLRMAFRPSIGRAPSSALNAEIAAALLSAFDSTTFESNGLFPSLWMSRLANALPAEDLLPDASLPVNDASQAFLMSGRWDSLRP